MEGFRSKSYGGVSYLSSSQPAIPAPLVVIPKNWKTSNGQWKRWNCSDPELKRKKRVARYKAYGMEGKIKGSVRKGFRWIKQRFNLVVYGCP